ncbi:MAG TPA: SAM-dependent chlorinase/fluorinase [Coleofasciculaceae cyanobacterium]
MSEHRAIALLSDFGLKDVYVGVMKGVIAQINPHLTVVDLTHQIPRQNIAAARFSLMNAYAYFPQGTVYVAVVDPGVGSQRRGIAIQTDAGFLVGPDNGLFSGVLAQTRVIAAVELTNSKYWLTSTPSTTFHGRDIFAPVGAHLASGVPIAQLGESIDSKTLVSLSIPERTLTASTIVGCIQYIDYFGNLVTNIPAADVQEKTWLVAVGNYIIPNSQTYSDRPLGEVVALIGSHGWVEIAVNGGSAQQELQLDWGASVQVLLP